MESRDEALIDRYLAQEASADEVREVEERRKNDPEFQQRLIDAERGLQALRVHERMELRNRFKKRDEILDRSSGNGPPQTGRTYWPWALTLVGLAILIWFLIPEKQTISPASVHEQDTLSTSGQREMPIDTNTTPLQSKEQPAAPVQEERKSSEPIADTKEQGDKLFAAYFSPYVDDLMDPAVRGDGELSPLEKFQLAYWEKRYADAVKEFPAISETMKQNDNTRFMYANALMAERRIQLAIPILESIVQNNRSRYTAESLYVLALGYCKAGDLQNGLRSIERYLQQEQATRKAEAQRIEQELK